MQTNYKIKGYIPPIEYRWEGTSQVLLSFAKVVVKQRKQDLRLKKGKKRDVDEKFLALLTRQFLAK